MADYISREAAVDAVRNVLLRSPTAAIRAMDALEHLPSAQPEKSTEERTETHSCDCVSREQAIDVIRAMQTYKLFAGDDLILVDQAGAQTELMMLPPAQQGRETGAWITVDYFADGKPAYREWKCSACGCVVEDEKPTWNFCPMCGADMREE